LSSGNVRGSVLLSRVEAAAPKGIEDRSHSIVTKRKPEQPAALPADASEDRRGKLKAIGGSQSDEWNNLLAKQAIQALRVNDASPEERDRQASAASAAIAALAGSTAGRAGRHDGGPADRGPTTRRWRAAGPP
jgi:hypothetical protein